jgi:hypothetical protein
MPVKAGIHMEGIPMPRFTEGVRLCEKPLKCHREDPDEVGRRGDLKNSKERARLLRPDKKHRDSQ